MSQVGENLKYRSKSSSWTQLRGRLVDHPVLRISVGNCYMYNHHSTVNNVVRFQKISILPTTRVEFPRGREVSKAKIFKGKYEAKPKILPWWRYRYFLEQLIFIKARLEIYIYIFFYLNNIYSQHLL